MNQVYVKQEGTEVAATSIPGRFRLLTDIVLTENSGCHEITPKYLPTYQTSPNVSASCLRLARSSRLKHLFFPFSSWDYWLLILITRWFLRVGLKML